MLKAIRSLFRGPEPVPPAVAFARQTCQVLEWWLIGFGDRGIAAATSLNVLEGAMDMHKENISVRAAAARLAHIMGGDIILSLPAAVREETLAYIRQPEVAEQLLTMNSNDSLILADLTYGFATDDAKMNAALRPQIYAGVMKAVPATGLSTAAHNLYTAVRHLWGRAVVALAQGREDEELRAQVRVVIDDTLFALEGENFETRQRRRIEAMIEEAFQPQPEQMAEGDDA
jgi:hypothetical protein